MSARFRIMSVSVLVGLATSLSFSLCHNAAAEPQTLFFTDATAGFVYSINPDGTGLTPIVTAGGSVSYGGVAVDILNERVYFSDATNSEVIRVDTDGANSLTLTSSALFVRSVAVDPSRNKVFYTPGTGNKTIVASDLDGGGAVTIYSPGPGGPEDLKVDTDAAKIYFADGGDNTIKRINEDGSGVETIISAAETPYGLALDLTNDKLYWTLNAAGEIHRADLDGSNQELVLGGLSGPRGITVDGADGPTMYWIEATGPLVRKRNLTTLAQADIADVSDGLSSPMYIGFLPQPVLTPGTTLDEPPLVSLDEGTRHVTLTFRDFTDAELASTSAAADRASFTAAATLAAAQPSVRYVATVRRPSDNLVKKVVSKNQRVGFSLPPGTWRATYHARAVVPKSSTKKAADKAELKEEIADLKAISPKSIAIKNKLQKKKALLNLVNVKTKYKTNESPVSDDFVIEPS